MKAATHLENLVLSGLKGGVEDTEWLHESYGCVTHSKLFCRTEISTEFMNVESIIDMKDVRNLKTLVAEL